MNVEHLKIMDALVVGLEIEFYSNKSKKEAAKDVAKLLRKKVEVGNVYHSRIVVDQHNFKIESDYTGGMKMMELVTGPMPYFEAISCLAKLLTYIRTNGWTDEKCALQANLSFDKMKVKTKATLEAINRLKFVLGFDENFIYKRFPKRKNSIYARSINSIFPINKFVFSDEFDAVYENNYELPNEKYYGVNFTKLAKGYLEIRYMGGRGYERMFHEVRDVIDYCGTFIYNTLQNNYEYTPGEVMKLRNAMREFKKVVRSFSDMDAFFLNYPNIKLMVDLKGEREVVKTFYPKLREKIFELIVKCGVRRGMINYDADVGKYQIKNAIITKAFTLNTIEVFDSKIQGGNIVTCDLYRCHINNSHVLDSNVFAGNVIHNSKIVDSPFQAYNEAHDCYIDNRRMIINGKVEGGVIRSGEVGPLAKVSDETEIVDAMMDSKDKKDAPALQNGGLVPIEKDKK